MAAEPVSGAARLIAFAKKLCGVVHRESDFNIFVDGHDYEDECVQVEVVVQSRKLKYDEHVGWVSIRSSGAGEFLLRDVSGTKHADDDAIGSFDSSTKARAALAAWFTKPAKAEMERSMRSRPAEAAAELLPFRDFAKSLLNVDFGKYTYTILKETEPVLWMSGMETDTDADEITIGFGVFVATPDGASDDIDYIEAHLHPGGTHVHSTGSRSHKLKSLLDINIDLPSSSDQKTVYKHILVAIMRSGYFEKLKQWYKSRPVTAAAEPAPKPQGYLRFEFMHSGTSHTHSQASEAASKLRKKLQGIVGVELVKSQESTHVDLHARTNAETLSKIFSQATPIVRGFESDIESGFVVVTTGYAEEAEEFDFGSAVGDEKRDFVELFMRGGRFSVEAAAEPITRGARFTYYTLPCDVSGSNGDKILAAVRSAGFGASMYRCISARGLKLNLFRVSILIDKFHGPEDLSRKLKSVQDAINRVYRSKQGPLKLDKEVLVRLMERSRVARSPATAAAEPEPHSTREVTYYLPINPQYEASERIVKALADAGFKVDSGRRISPRGLKTNDFCIDVLLTFNGPRDLAKQIHQVKDIVNRVYKRRAGVTVDDQTVITYWKRSRVKDNQARGAAEGLPSQNYVDAVQAHLPKILNKPLKLGDRTIELIRIRKYPTHWPAVDITFTVSRAGASAGQIDFEIAPNRMRAVGTSSNGRLLTLWATETEPDVKFMQSTASIVKYLFAQKHSGHDTLYWFDTFVSAVTAAAEAPAESSERFRDLLRRTADVVLAQWLRDHESKVTVTVHGAQLNVCPDRGAGHSVCFSAVGARQTAPEITVVQRGNSVRINSSRHRVEKTTDEAMLGVHTPKDLLKRLASWITKDMVHDITSYYTEAAAEPESAGSVNMSIYKVERKTLDYHLECRRQGGTLELSSGNKVLRIGVRLKGMTPELCIALIYGSGQKFLCYTASPKTNYPAFASFTSKSTELDSRLAEDAVRAYRRIVLENRNSMVRYLIERLQERIDVVQIKEYSDALVVFSRLPQYVLHTDTSARVPYKSLVLERERAISGIARYGILGFATILEIDLRKAEEKHIAELRGA